MNTRNKYPQLAGLHGNARAKMYQQLRAAEKVAVGLTTRGKTRRLRWHPELYGKSAGEQKKIHERSRRQRFYDQGLTARGTPRKRIFRNRRTETAWKSFRSTIQVRALSWDDCWGGHYRLERAA